MIKTMFLCEKSSEYLCFEQYSLMTLLYKFLLVANLTFFFGTIIPKPDLFVGLDISIDRQSKYSFLSIFSNTNLNCVVSNLNSL